MSGTFGTRFDTLRRAQKKKTGVPLYTLFINRPIGRVIAAVSPEWMTPNGLTAIGAVLTYGSLVYLMFFAAGGGVSLLVGILLVLGFFFDSGDGQLARLRNAGSLSGEWLDHVLDGGRIVLMHFATGWFLVRVGALPAALAVLVAAAFAVSATLIFVGGLLFDKLNTAHRVPPGTIPAGGLTRRSVIRSTVMLPVDYGLLCVAYVLVALPGVFGVVYAVFALATLLFAGAFMAKWYRALRLIDRRAAAAAAAVSRS